jgi:hypothetical protein
MFLNFDRNEAFFAEILFMTAYLTHLLTKWQKYPQQAIYLLKGRAQTAKSLTKAVKRGLSFTRNEKTSVRFQPV